MAGKRGDAVWDPPGDGQATGAELVTPEAVALEFPLAGVGSRGLAYLLDLLIVGTALVLLALALAAFAIGVAVEVPSWAGIAVVLVLLLAVQFGYPTAFETLWRGRTPGKAALGLRVLTAEGGPVTFRHAAIRAALGIVDFQITLGTAAFVTALVDPRSRRIGDIAAGTVVVRERSAAGEVESVDFVAPAHLRSYAQRLDVGALGAAEYQAVRTFLRRAAALEPEHRQRLARDLAERLLPRVQPLPPPGTPDEELLQAVAAAAQRRHRTGPARPPSAAPPTPAGRTLRPSTGDAPGDPPPASSADPAEPPPPPPPGGFAPPS